MKKTNFKWFGIVMLIIFSSVGIVSADIGDNYQGCGMMRMMNWGYFGIGMWFFMVIVWLLVVTALILFILWLIKQINKK